MIQINGRITLPEGVLEQARAAIVTMAKASQAEDGCLDYTFAEDLTAPGTLILFERWRDEAAVDAHGESDHMAVFQQELAKYDGISRAIRMYVTDDGQAL